MSAASPPVVPRGVTRPIPGELLRLALPVLASQVLRVAFQWVDALWVRGLGVDATAAVTTSVFVMWTVYSLQDVVGLGLAAYVSQLLGAGERARAGLAVWKGLRAVTVMGLAVGLMGAPGARFVYEHLGAPPDVVRSGTAYLSVILGAALLPMVGMTCEAVMRSSGDTRTPLFIDLAAVAVNAVLAPVFIYGYLGVPAMGIAGAAWATVVGQTVMVAGYLLCAWRRHPAFPFARLAPGPPVRVMSMVRVGLPAAIIGMTFSLVYLAFVRSASRFGAASIAIVGIANRIEALQFVASVSLGTAGASLVGQNLGAGRADRAVQAIRTGLIWNLWLSSAVTILLLAVPGVFINLFTQDPEVHRIGVPYLRILALCLVVNGIEIVTAEAVLGSGHTKALSWIFCSFSALRVPLAFWVPDLMQNGALGIAWVISVTCIVRGTIIAVWASRGTWKRGLSSELGLVPPVPPPPDGAV